MWRQLPIRPAPTVYRPGATNVNVLQQAGSLGSAVESRPAPPVYRPEQQVVGLIQSRTALLARAESRPAPPVYRPEQQAVGLIQSRTALLARAESRPTPPVYRPEQQAVGLIQSQTALLGRAGSRPVPPVYRYAAATAHATAIQRQKLVAKIGDTVVETELRDPARIKQEVKSFENQVLKRLFSGKEPSGWGNFEALMKMIKAKKIPFPIEGVLHVPLKAILNAGMQGLLPEVGTQTGFVGSEREQRRRVALPGKTITYDMTMAATAGNAPGFSIPLLRLASDGIIGKADHARVEMVFGPVATSDTATQFIQERVTRIFQQCMTNAANNVKLSVIVGTYNTAITAAGIPNGWILAGDQGEWERRTPEDEVGVSTEPESVQTNVEIPFLKIGAMGDTTIPALIHKAEEKVLFETCRAKANKIADDKFRPIAFHLHGTIFNPATIKLGKLRSFLTLHLFVVATQATLPPDSKRNPKMLFGFLPKLGGTGAILHVLSNRDRLILNSALRGGLEKELFAAAKEIVNNAERFHAEKTMGLISEVFASKDEKTGTPAGKPLDPRRMDITRGALSTTRHMAVFELRDPAHPVNAMYTAVKPQATDISGSNASALLVAAQVPLGERAAKTLLKPLK